MLDWHWLPTLHCWFTGGGGREKGRARRAMGKWGKGEG